MQADHFRAGTASAAVRLSLIHILPEDRVVENQYAKVWRKSSYGRPILGTRESLRRIGRGELRRVLKRRYSPDRVVAVSYTHLLKDLSVLDGLLPGLSEASKSLDVTVLHTLVLEKLFGIDKENMACLLYTSR